MGINVAFRLTGGVGKAVLQLNFIDQLYKYLDDTTINFVLYYLDDHKINEVLFRKQPFINNYYKGSSFSPEKYDLAIELSYFPNVIVYREEIIRSISPKFKELVDSWVAFKQNPTTGFLITKMPESEYNLCKYLEIVGKTALNSLDTSNKLSMTTVSYKIYINPDKEKILYRHGLKSGQYITIN